MTIYRTYTENELERAVYISPSDAAMRELTSRFFSIVDDNIATSDEIENLQDRLEALEEELYDCDCEKEIGELKAKGLDLV